MPRISVADLPVVSHTGRVSKYAVEMTELEELLSEDDFGAGEACKFEIHKDDLNALVSSLRKVGKGKGRKVKCLFKDGDVYVQDNGPIDSEPESATAIRESKAAGNKAK